MSNKKIIYQMALRTFTPEGTLKAAEKLLTHVASLHVDIIYLCPVFKADNDEDRTTWSPRQIETNTNNPKNPYKMSDYFNVDEEYGSNEDLKDFVKEAHKNGLKVLFDLVYLHCGKNAVFIKENPDFVEQNADGTIAVGEQWPFARLNFKNPDLRKYLFENMKTFVTEYAVDGFRCDVGDQVPLDFWEESFKALKEIKPDLITLNEGTDLNYIKGIFDMEYAFQWTENLVDVFANAASAQVFRNYCIQEKEKYGDHTKKLIRTVDTHDTASDAGLNRNEITMTTRGVEAALVITTTYEGVPFFWNGYEVCDNAENCMFSNRDFGRRSAANWSRGFTHDGARRMEFIKKIHTIFHECDIVNDGMLEWVDNDAEDAVISYLKSYQDKKVLVAVNTKNKNVDVNIDIDPKEIYIVSGVTLLDKGAVMEPYGYIVTEIND
ncbi:alpha-amylase family glycosyl hydrolase [Ructibacterium gallinarum]|uniref:Glycosyl hydrolase family 13 catalytic domain-containing protein n=1 Tax=Ructibacterium gallinarum TaxID=2779355 RepID=A0A9D5M737_9FIRM|nr:alpha-amylase family glycosyl hydrolase [Ructibacterium gallinarum]MBE5040727.1 hypothetical protein [Ructibacterium gallinarum]